MVRCARCCVHNSLRGVNIFVNLCGVCIIIYSLWLEKMWELGLAELPSTTNLPKPWFIIVCFGVGITVCLSTLSGFMVANCISNSSLCIYIISLCSLVFLEAAVLVMIFFKMDWSKLISDYIDAHHKKFKAFVIFHLVMCRLIVIMALVLQIVVVLFALILWALGTKPRTHDFISDIPDFRQSFLVAPTPSIPIIHDSGQFCRKCGDFCGSNPRESFLSYIEGIIRTRFRRRTVDVYPEISG